MVATVPADIEEALGVVRATAPTFFKGVSNLSFRRRLWLKMLKEHGVIEYNATGVSFTWNVEYSQPPVSQATDAGDIMFNDHDALKQCTIDVRGYRSSDRLTEKQKLMNAGPQAIDNLYMSKSERIARSIMHKLCGELYVDGNANGNGNRFHGIESFMGEGTVAAGDKVAMPDDDYAGLATDLDTGGSWSTDLASADRPNSTLATDWPFGNGDLEYDYFSPLLVNVSSTAWPTGSTEWIDNCEEVLRFITTAQTVRGALDDDQSVPFMHMLAADRFNDFKTFYAARNMQTVPHKQASDLGFPMALNFEGAMVQTEFDIPAGTGYGISPTMMEMFSMYGQLISPVGPQYAIEKDAYLYLARVFGNLRFQPKFFAKHKAYA